MLRGVARYILPVLVLTLSAGCAPEGESESIPPTTDDAAAEVDRGPFTQTSTLTATVEGTPFVADAFDVSKAGDAFVVEGTDSATGRIIALSINGASVGPNSLTERGASARWEEGPGRDQDFSVFSGSSGTFGSGEINITRFDDERLQGTFSFTGRNRNGETRALTDGRLDVAF